MRPAEGLECLYIDFDSFFASAEQSLQPRLAGRPVGILPVESESTCLIAASREAKQRGVKTGMMVREARARCPDLIFVLARHDAYVKLHHELIALVDRFVPVHGVRSVDEIVCRLLRNEQARVRTLARAIKQELRAHYGPALTCSIGIAANEMLAKVAAEMNKPDGFVMLEPDKLPHSIAHLPLTDLPGIGAGHAERLRAAAIGDVQALWALAPKQMRALWHSVEGERFWAALHGYAMERSSTERCMFGHSRVLAWDWRTPGRVRACARLLLVKAARRMRREHFAARLLTLNLRFRGQAPLSFEHRFTTPVRDDHSALDALETLLRGALNGLQGQRPKLVHVFLHGLVKENERAFDLFEQPQQARQRRRWEILADITDRLVARYNKKSLSLGPVVEPPGGYAGGKIAFNRVPDLADF